MIEELNKNLEILELERIKEILPEYVHKNKIQEQKEEQRQRMMLKLKLLKEEKNKC